MYVIANLPAVQRDLFLARALRRVEDAPRRSDTLRVEWVDMIVSFASDEAISEASVEVADDISIAVFTSRMESLIDCGAKTEGAAEWVLKYSTTISEYGSAGEVRRLLCDKIAALDGATGETIGVLKIKRRSVSAGYAKVRLVPADDSLQLVCRHTTAQGLKAIWKSVLWRLKPLHGTPGIPGNDAEWAELKALSERQGWGDPDKTSHYCYVYANGVDMQMSCADGAVPQVKKFLLTGNSNACHWVQLRQRLNGRKFKLITSHGQLYLRF
jgi:hypothetical protein